MRPRTSIAGLMAFIAVVAIGLAALRFPSQPWAIAVVAMTLAILLASVVLAIRGRRPGYWTGFAIFGWGFFLFAHAGIIDPEVREILTVLWPDAVHRLAGRPVVVRFPTPFPPNSGRPSSVYLNQVNVVPEFRAITTCLTALAFGFVGGWLALVAHRPGNPA